jgi:hypothetical protein
VKKPRSDSRLLNLPEDQFQALVDWLLAGSPYRVIKERLLKEFQVVTSNAALSDFWNTCAAPALLARRKRAVTLADEVAQDAAACPGRFDDATIDALKQKAFELAVNPQADPRDVKGLFMLILKSRDQELEQEKFRETMRSSIERGLDALYSEAQGNPEALALFGKFKAAVMKEVAEAA